MTAKRHISEEKFRIVYKRFCYHLQFQATINLLGFNIKVWKYLPSNHVSGVFSRFWCPIFLPLTTDHCYVLGWSKDDVKCKLDSIKSKYNSIDQWLAKLKNDEKEFYSTKYL